jgi:hypothetical protein
MDMTTTKHVDSGNEDILTIACVADKRRNASFGTTLPMSRQSFYNCIASTYILDSNH